MDQLPLRVPNHGPYVENNNGGQVVPGEGYPLRSNYSQVQFPNQILDFAKQDVERPAFVPFATGTDPRLNYEVEMSWGALVGPNNWSSSGTLTINVQARRNSAAAWTTIETVIYNLPTTISRGFVEGRTCRFITGPQIPGFVAGDPIEFRGVMARDATDNGNDIQVGSDVLNYNGNMKVTEML